MQHLGMKLQNSSRQVNSVSKSLVSAQQQVASASEPARVRDKFNVDYFLKTAISMGSVTDLTKYHVCTLMDLKPIQLIFFKFKS